MHWLKLLALSYS